jgi:hypothetical protein
MPRYAVDVKAFLNVTVNADTPAQARAIAENWVSWLSPTDEQLADYQTDHVGVAETGGFDIDDGTYVEVLDD